MRGGEITAEKWNELVRSYGGSFLQSWQWGELQKKIGKTVHRVSGDGYIGTAIEQRLPRGFFYRYFPHGPLLQDPRDKAAWERFAADAKAEAKEKELFIKCEPQLPDGSEEKKLLSEAGFRSGGMVQPQATIVIDLLRDEAAILRSISHASRYAIRTAERRGVKIREVAANGEKEAHFAEFWGIFEETNARHKLSRYQESYYRAVIGLEEEPLRSKLFFAEYKNEIIATALTVCFGSEAYYLFAGSKKGFGRMNAPTLMLWEIVKKMKGDGCRTFDLWGISHEDKAWAGITAFKSGFGGKEVRGIGAWDLPLKNRLYVLYKLLKRLV